MMDSPSVRAVLTVQTMAMLTMLAQATGTWRTPQTQLSDVKCKVQVQRFILQAEAKVEAEAETKAEADEAKAKHVFGKSGPLSTVPSSSTA